MDRSFNKKWTCVRPTQREKSLLVLWCVGVLTGSFRDFLNYEVTRHLRCCLCYSRCCQRDATLQSFPLGICMTKEFVVVAVVIVAAQPSHLQPDVLYEYPPCVEGITYAWRWAKESWWKIVLELGAFTMLALFAFTNDFGQKKSGFGFDQPIRFLHIGQFLFSTLFNFFSSFSMVFTITENVNS